MDALHSPPRGRPISPRLQVPHNRPEKKDLLYHADDVASGFVMLPICTASGEYGVKISSYVFAPWLIELKCVHQKLAERMASLC